MYSLVLRKTLNYVLRRQRTLRLHQRKPRCVLSSCATVRLFWRSSGAMETSTVVALYLPE